MARSRITDTRQDLITDGGAVLWSIIQGEQLEFPVVLNFIEDASVKPSNNYIYEAVVVEAANIQDQVERPTQVELGGIQTRLFVRLPVYLGQWQAAVAYNKEDVILYSGKYYKLLFGSARISSTTPDVDPLWEETLLNRIYIQFPDTLSLNWLSAAPNVNSPVYGFFELRVTEPTDPVFSRTFKPIRGMVEILFSPTANVADQLNQTQPS
jgi:hypothetical protein